MHFHQAESDRNMIIKKIIVGYAKVETLGKYNNVKSSLTLEAELEQLDDPAKVLSDLHKQCQRHVETQIDKALEESGQPARYSDEERAYLYRCNHRKLLVLFSEGTKPPSSMYDMIGGLHRKSYALSKSAELRTDQPYDLKDFTGMDMSLDERLPPLYRGRMEYYRDSFSTQQVNTFYAESRDAVQVKMNAVALKYQLKHYNCLIFLHDQLVGKVVDGKAVEINPVPNEEDIPF